MPCRDGCLEVVIGGGNDAHVRLAGPGLAHALVFPLLEQAEQLGLDLERQIADLIEEERAAVRGGDFAPGVLERAGEGALDMAEEFALEQVRGKGSGN